MRTPKRFQKTLIKTRIQTKTRLRQWKASGKRKPCSKIFKFNFYCIVFTLIFLQNGIIFGLPFIYLLTLLNTSKTIKYTAIKRCSLNIGFITTALCVKILKTKPLSYIVPLMPSLASQLSILQ